MSDGIAAVLLRTHPEAEVANNISDLGCMVSALRSCLLQAGRYRHKIQIALANFFMATLSEIERVVDEGDHVRFYSGGYTT